MMVSLWESQVYFLKLTEREATHQDFQLAKSNGGTVEEIGRQPSLMLITVANCCALDERERGRESLHKR